MDQPRSLANKISSRITLSISNHGHSRIVAVISCAKVEGNTLRQITQWLGSDGGDPFLENL